MFCLGKAREGEELVLISGGVPGPPRGLKGIRRPWRPAPPCSSGA